MVSTEISYFRMLSTSDSELLRFKNFIGFTEIKICLRFLQKSLFKAAEEFKMAIIYRLR